MRAIYEGMRSVGNERTCNLTRSGYSGQQKYGAILWSGDTASRWETLKYQIASGLSFAASGMPWWTLDIGGFFVKYSVERFFGIVVNQHSAHIKNYVFNHSLFPRRFAL